MATVNDLQAKTNCLPSSFQTSEEVSIQIDTSSRLKHKKESRTRLVWQNVNFRPVQVSFKVSMTGIKLQRDRRQIISDLTGELACGELKAIVGPSGVGKSTLLKIITGRKVSDVTGKVSIRGAYVRDQKSSATRSLVKIAYIPQHDFHLKGLTVKESLLYASRLKNYGDRSIDTQAFENTDNQNFQNATNDSPENDYKFEESKGGLHRRLVHSILKVLMLEECADTLVTQCSGGQVRRLSIGVELLSFPKLIILDEPTTGLDFVSALQTMRLLRSLVDSAHRPGIMCTIHQPSSEILRLFTNLYIIGNGGVCIYDGPTETVEERTTQFGLQCPPYFNIADFLLQCSYGEFGNELVSRMAHQQKLEHRNKSLGLIHSKNRKDFLIHDYYQQMVNGPKPFFYQLWILFGRTFRNQLRTSQIIALKIVSGILIAIYLGSLHNYHIGEADYCLAGPLFEQVDFSKITFQEFAMQTQSAAENVACTSYLLMFIAFIESIPTCLTFSREMHVIIKEKSNGWYSCLAYYIAKTVVEMPFQFLGPLVSLSIYYPLTGQSSEYWRFGIILSAFILCALIVRIIGMMVGSIFIDDELSSVLTISALIAIFILVGGLFIKDSQVNWVLEPFYFISVVKFAFHIMMNGIYGLGRCEGQLPLDFPLEFDREKFDDFGNSLIMMWFEVETKDFWIGYIGLSTMFVVMIVITYLILNFQIDRLAKE